MIRSTTRFHVDRRSSRIGWCLVMMIMAATTVCPSAFVFFNRIPQSHHATRRTVCGRNKLPPMIAGRPSFLVLGRREQRRSLIFSSSVEADGFVKAEDLEALQALFSKYCDEDGLMSKTMVLQIPTIDELMQDGDLQREEFDDIWSKASKFPDMNTAEERVDVDSFVQVYRDIDDLFEDEEEDEKPPAETKDANNGDDNGIESSMTPEEEELVAVFRDICSQEGALSKEELTSWDELQKLLDEGLLGRNELDTLWESSKTAENIMDLPAFLKFNKELDDLFDFEDEEGTDAMDEVVDQSDLSPEELFELLAATDGLVGMNELLQWDELQDMIREGDLLSSELDKLYNKCLGSSGRLDLAGFLSLYQAIGDLFEDGDGELATVAVSTPKKETPAPSQGAAAKAALFQALDAMNSKEDVLPCGLEATPEEEKRIMNIVELLESDSGNVIRTKGGALTMSDLSGTWELLYSSSSAMKFNKGLSGLGGSFPNGKFGGLTQSLTSSKFLADVEYTERIDVRPSSASFDVTVTGGWELRQSVSLFTGQPSTVLTVVPELVTYGPTSTKADHWKSLGPMNMLDITYLDDSMRIMRGNTSMDTIFIFRRVSL